VADIDRVERAADKILAETERGHQIAVVVSAMAGVTNQLVEYCRKISPLHDAREYDSVVASGENVTSGLLALALQKRGIQARSWQGWQVPIRCTEAHGKARILDIDVTEMKERLSANEVAVLAGFQGVTERNRITTLGRGGSDTTAVALAAALGAERCDIYTDVQGVFTTDPRIVPQARRLEMVSYEEMLEMASLGAKVLQTRSVEMAMKCQVPIQVLSSLEDQIGSDFPGTIVTKEENIMEQEIVNGITYTKDEAQITLVDVPDVPGAAAKIFGPLSEASINVDMIVQNVSPDGALTDLTFTVPQSDLARGLDALNRCEVLKQANIRSETNVVKVSVVGIGMRSHAGVASKMFEALASKNINIKVISTSEIKISVLLSAEYTELAVRTLHDAYGLKDKSAQGLF
jgi:aspartate kinase